MRQWRFDTGEVALNAVQLSEAGPPLILLHGAGSRWQSFDAILPALQNICAVYALDLRGHGESGHAPGAYHLRDYARDVVQFVTLLDRPVTIYGHSLGALVALYAAGEIPALMRGLVLGDPPLYYHNTDIRDTFWYEAFSDLVEFITAHRSVAALEAALEARAPDSTPAWRQRRSQELAVLDPDAPRMVMDNRLMADVDLSLVLDRVRCPVLLLQGHPEKRPALRPEDADFAKAHLADCKVVVMEDRGHGLPGETVLAEVVRFVA